MLKVRNDYPKSTMGKEVPVINDKTISYDLLLNLLGMRFHECLKLESKEKPNLADTLTDADLIHKVCRKERLTFFNFLREHTSDTVLHTEENLKERLNNEYGYYFPKKEDDQNDTTQREVDYYGTQWFIKRDSVLR